MELPPLILASVSPRRAELLQQLQLSFRVVPSETTEVHTPQFTARELAKVNAYRKARSVAADFPDALVLAADTLVCLGPQLFGKPADLAEAHRMLSQLQGQAHEVITGVCLMVLRQNKFKVFEECTEVRFRPLNPEQIADYLGRIDPLDKAGAYAIQQRGDLIVQSIVGSYSNVVGLPLGRLEIELNEWSAAEDGSA